MALGVADKHLIEQLLRDSMAPLWAVPYRAPHLSYYDPADVADAPPATWFLYDGDDPDEGALGGASCAVSQC